MSGASDHDHAEIWRAIRELQGSVKEIEREMDDEQMSAAVKAGVDRAMRGRIAIPIGLLPRAVVAVAALVAIAGGIKGLIG